MHENGYVLRVSQLNEYVSGMLRRESLLQHIGVRGELSGLKRHASGHVYFSLKDESALIRCVMFRAKAMGLPVDLREGMQIVAYGSVSLFVRDGQYQLYVERVETEGEGALYKEFLQRKARLAAEGLFDAAHKKPLPVLPRAVGVVTSPTGAVIRDIENVSARRFAHMPILLYPAAVQGPGAAEEIAAAIGRANEEGRADVLIVGRGGGSLEDLWPFNEEIVARAIYGSELPVVSAVGHETDETISDYAADCRAPTPSAAAELCVPLREALYAALRQRRESLRALCMGKLETERGRLSSFAQSAAMAEPAHGIAMRRAALSGFRASMEREARTALMACAGRVAELGGRLEGRAPQRILESGYALVRREGRYIARAQDLHAGNEAELLFADGTVQAVVREITERSGRG